ncbi:hypothetical protein ABEG45_22440 [Pantoea agglomerans]|uniref:hypothetical protein n=1 Tax=Enterobacter agglomerans TaxID=549 RepID=UPI00320A5D50
MDKLQKISDYEKKLLTGEAVAESPRQIIRDVSSGKILSNGKVEPVNLPVFLIQRTETNIFYNDTDVKSLLREVRAQASSIIQEIKDSEFEGAGEKYQQFLDQFATCMECPTEGYLHDVRVMGVNLYTTLQTQVRRLSDAIQPKNNPSEETEKRFCAVTEANLNLFFHMLIINLAMSNRIDDSTGVLRQKLTSLEATLRGLMNDHVFAKGDGSPHPSGVDIHDGKLLYGWILLKNGDIESAESIFRYDYNMRGQITFSGLFKNVMSLINKRPEHYQRELTFREKMTDTFGWDGVPESRVRLALQIAYYLQQCETIRGYITELTSGSDDEISCPPDINMQSLLTSSNS